MLLLPKYDNLYAVRDTDINRIVQDYRAGRIDSKAFREMVTTWKKDWHDSIADIIPGHRLEVLVDANSRLPLFRLTFTGYDKDPRPVAAAEGHTRRIRTFTVMP